LALGPQKTARKITELATVVTKASAVKLLRVIAIAAAQKVQNIGSKHARSFFGCRQHGEKAS
jgi:hypothetical protein